MNDDRAPSCTPFIVNSPLWTRAPSRDENGCSYIDFMMLIPGLKNMNQAGQESVQIKIKNCLKDFENMVVYVDLNSRLNLLWISIKPVPKISQHIMQAIQHAIPESKVVAGDFNPQPEKTSGRQPLLTKIKQNLKKGLFIR